MYGIQQRVGNGKSECEKLNPLYRHTSREVFHVVKELCHMYAIFKLGMLQVRENEISLRKWSGGTAHLRSRTT